MTTINARVERDSISHDVRLTTVVATYPRFIHSELMTHRAFSRNAASSRAIPIEKVIERVVNDPAMPVEWGANRKGMQAGDELDTDMALQCRSQWLHARDRAVEVANNMATLGLHKQIVNRILEPWCWITTIITATDWRNFFKLRCHHMAQPEFRVLACAIRDAMTASEPDVLDYNEWHLPFIQSLDSDNNVSWEYLCKISAARCARVSYLTHDGRRDHQADLNLYEHLINPDPNDPDAPIHASALEHVASPDQPDGRCGNFRGWRQLRYDIPNHTATDGVW